MPKEKRISRILCCGRSPAYPYPSTTATDKNKNKNKNKNMLIKLAKSVYNKKVMEEAKCSICMEPPHNGVILLCSSIEKGCRPYLCNTICPHSNCLKRFLKSPASISCPLCGGEVDNNWIVVENVRNFMNSIPRNCSVETCKFTGNYLELKKHAILEHPLSVVNWMRTMRLERKRDSEDRDLIALGNDFERVVAVNEDHHHQESFNSF